MCSCSNAFVTLRACAVIVVGVTGSMPVHGIGTAQFKVRLGDREVILRIYNCLLCHGEEGFNLISVSQMLRTKLNSINFTDGNSEIVIRKHGKVHKIPLNETEGLYELVGSPISVDHQQNLPRFDLTLESDAQLFEDDLIPASMMKSPSTLGRWTRKVLWLGTKSVCTVNYDNNAISVNSATRTFHPYHKHMWLEKLTK